MEIQGQQHIAAPCDKVWHALNDPAILQQCLPGCESVVQQEPHHFKVTVRVAIGPLRARFQGKLQLSNVQAPTSCTMHFEGQGGANGFGQGSAEVKLAPSGNGTDLHYAAQVQVGGKLAQIGSRLIESVARKMTDDFFQAFQRALQPPEVPQASNAPARAPSAATGRPAAGTSAAAAAPGHTPHADGPQVPAWWLAPAAVLGGLLVILGGHYLH
jgi:carbon monoxide dehydrogenase subunit G